MKNILNFFLNYEILNQRVYKKSIKSKGGLIFTKIQNSKFTGNPFEHESNFTIYKALKHS